MLSDGFYDPMKPLFIRYRDLPHWRQDGGTYYVTFRLIDSLPAVRLEQWRRERDEWLSEHANATKEELDEFLRKRRNQIERWLDEGHGCCVLARADARTLVENAIRHFEGVRYELGESTVAPNHVHAIVRPALGLDISDVMHSWKRYTSRELQKLPNFPAHLRPNVWQQESFDHLVRDALSLERFSGYIVRHNTIVGRVHRGESGAGF